MSSSGHPFDQGSLRGVGYQPSSFQSDADFRRDTLDQARLYHHDGNLCLDPLNAEKTFSRHQGQEGRQHWSPYIHPSASGSVGREASPEPEIPSGSTSGQSNELLLQLMTEMRYLRQRVDSLPQKNAQEVVPDVRRPLPVPEPEPEPEPNPESSADSSSSSSDSDMVGVEFPDPGFPTGPASNTDIITAGLPASEMSFFRGLIRKHVAKEVCPLPPQSPSLSQPKIMLFGSTAPPVPDDPRLSIKALAALPPSPSVIDCAKLLDHTVRDAATGSVGHQRSPISTLDSCGPGAWTAAGKFFTPSLPAVDKYKPDYYRIDTSSCGRDTSVSVLRDERQVSTLASKASASPAYKELKNEELRTLLASLAIVRWPSTAFLKAFVRVESLYMKRQHSCVHLFMSDCVMQLPSRLR
jgi:hypothetical protein